MSARAPHVCPICGCEALPRNGTPKNASFPFCSPACKVVDLGRWFDGTYRIPAPSELEGSFSSPAPSPELRPSSESDEEREGEATRKEDE